MKTQFGELVTADLHEGTLTIEVGETIIAQAGKYAVMPIEIYEKLVNGVDEKTKAALNLPFVSGSLLPDMELEEAEVLSRECDYACFAVEQDDNEINTADASAFFLEGYLEAQNRLKRNDR